MGSIKAVADLALPGIKLLSFQAHTDERGQNIKILSTEDLKEAGIDFAPLEILSMHSKRNVLRGVHFQKIYSQSRMIYCTSGSLFLVMVNVDKDSSCFGQSCSYLLRAKDEAVYLPAAYALGTLAMTDTDFLCLCGEHSFAGDYAAGMNWADEDLGIKWPLQKEEIIVSVGDDKLPSYKIVMKELAE